MPAQATGKAPKQLGDKRTHLLKSVNVYRKSQHKQTFWRNLQSIYYLKFYLMKRFSRSIFLAVTAILLCSKGLFAQEVRDGLTWYTDVNKVYEVSQKTRKPVFAFFTGSDWCGWCHRLEHNVFEKPGFKEWAKKNVILLEVDFPRNKKLPEALMAQNSQMQNFFQVQGYPTIWMFTMSKEKGSEKMAIAALGSLGYPQSEPGKEEVAFLENANNILKNGAKKN